MDAAKSAKTKSKRGVKSSRKRLGMRLYEDDFFGLKNKERKKKKPRASLAVNTKITPPTEGYDEG
jgi:hypothetical protein